MDVTMLIRKAITWGTWVVVYFRLYRD